MKRSVLFAMVLLSCIRAAAASAQHPTVDPVGRYGIEFEMTGQSQTGVLIIVKNERGDLSGMLEVHGQDVPLDTVSVSGNQVTLTATHAHLTLTFRLGHDGRVQGTYQSHGSTGAFSGVREKK